jgi:hypothetical protein
MAAPTKKDTSIRADVSDSIKQIVRQELANYSLYSGVANQSKPQIVTNYNQTENEHVIRGRTNSLIILGHDRPQGVGSGYGGVGQDHCSTIDLIAGHMGTKPIDAVNGVKILSDKNFELDSARVYISQLCDLDSYFGIPKQYIRTGEDPSSVAQLQISDQRSGVGIKADVICLVGRENIKICTHHKGVNSLNNEVHPGGIDIIAGIDSVDRNLILQPMVKGNNLKNALRDIIKAISDVQKTVTDFINTQLELNDILSNHVHQQTSLTNTDEMLNKAKFNNSSKNLYVQSVKHLENLIDLSSKTFKYLNEGEDCITSKYNRVN